MTHTDIIREAQALVGKDRKLLTAEEKLIIGRALLIGRAENVNDNDFGKWRKENGFGHLRRNELADYQWLAENAHYDWFTEHANTNNVREARLAWEAEQDKLHGQSKRDRIVQKVAELTENGDTISSQEIQAQFADISDVPRHLSPLVQQGRLVRPKRNSYRLPTEQEKAEQAAENAKAQQAEEKATGTLPGWSALTRSGFGDVLRKVKKWVRQSGQTAPFSRSADKQARIGTTVEAFFPAEGETYREAVENAEPVSETLVTPASSGIYLEDTTHEVIGWVKGYRARVVVDPVWIPVNNHFESLDHHYKTRKESPWKEGNDK